MASHYWIALLDTKIACILPASMQENNPYHASPGMSEPDPPPRDLVSGGEASFDLSRCIDTAKAVYTDQLGPAVGILLLTGLLIIFTYIAAFAMLGGLVALAATASYWVAVALGAVGVFGIAAIFFPLQAGLALLGLYMVRRSLSVRILFLGFQRYWPVFSGMFVLFLISLLVQLPSYLLQGAAILLSVEAGASASDISSLGSFFSFFGNLLSLPFAAVNLWLTVRLILVPVLLVERKMPVGESLRLSWNRTAPFQWWLVLFYLLAGAIGLVGLFACGVGLLFSVPFAMAMYGSAIEQLLGEAK